MSTKIYNAYISKRKFPSAHAVLKASIALRDELRPVSERAYYDTWAMFLIPAIDRAVATGKKPYDAYREVCEDEMKAKREFRSGMREPFWDVNAEWSIIPLKDGHVLIQMFAERNILGHWKWQADWKDFHYQNQSDPPDDVPSWAWKHREKTWDEVLGDEPPCSAAFGMKLWGDYSGPRNDLKRVLARQKSKAKRAREIAFGLLRDERIKAQPKPKKDDGSGWYELVTEAEKWLRSDEGKQAMADKTASLMPILPLRITRELIFRK